MEERHRALLVRQNPQWAGEEIEAPEFRRDIFPEIEKFLQERQALAIVGLRRVGKTVLLRQLMKGLKARPENSCYISFDDRDFQKYELAFELVYYFLQNSNKEYKRYLFLDEIQKVPNWQDLVKTLYDTEKNLKILVSGSSSLELKQYKETLAGRLLTFNLPVFTFREFARYHGLPSRISRDLREYDLKFSGKKSAYSRLFEEYLLKGAFPELIGKGDEYVKKYITELIDKVISDISKNIDSGKEPELAGLIQLFCKSSGRQFEINNMASVLKMNRNTVSRYISLLEKAFLIRTSYNFTRSAARKLRISKKGYLAHSCIPISYLNFPFDMVRMEGSDLGHMVETAIASNLGRLSFWKRQNHEIDFVLEDGTPVEIKYQGQISPGDIKPLIAFLDTRKQKNGILVTKDKMEKRKAKGRDILLVPAWVFLLGI